MIYIKVTLVIISGKGREFMRKDMLRISDITGFSLKMGGTTE